MTTNQNPIKGVACFFQDKCYLLPPPYRHSDVIAAIRILNPGVKGPYSGPQGFYDERGKFLSRKLAFAMTVGTEHYISSTPHPSGLLFSEDVWATPGDWSAPEGTDEHKAYHDVYNDQARAKHCIVKSIEEVNP